MAKRHILFALMALIGGTASIGSVIQHNPISDESAYFGTATIKGKVTILNHPQLGKTAGSSTYLVFRKLECDSCFLGVRTDPDGSYQIRVAPGQYRLVVLDG